MATMASLFPTISNYTWGGSTAIKKEIFEKLKIAEKWKTGFSDDLILTEAIKNQNLHIKFVPQSVIESPEETTVTTFLKWGSQQFTWMRWYYPLVYYLGLIGFLILHVIIIIGSISLYYGYLIPGMLILSTILFEMIFGITGIVIFRKLLDYPKPKYGSIAKYAILMPIVFLFLSYNFLISSAKREIIWAGTSYRKYDK
jgi:hypothetical protein